jgi:hypothetical protein
VKTHSNSTLNKPVERVIIPAKTCMDVTIYDYIRAFYHKEYEPFGGYEQYTDVFEEYCRQLEVANYTELMEIYREIIRLQATYDCVRDCIFILSIKRDEVTIGHLAKLGYRYAFPADNIDKYMKDLEMVDRKSKSLILQLKIKNTEFEKLQKESGSKENTESDFIDGVIIIGRFMGFRIDMKQTTLGEFAAMQKQYNKFYEKKINEN